MLISSRTPEGLPNHCPICGASVCIEPSQPFGDAPCPSCGHLLWFLNFGSEQRLFLPPKSRTIRERVLQFLAEQLGVSRSSLDADNPPVLVNDLGADSLDLVELVMELEEELE